MGWRVGGAGAFPQWGAVGVEPGEGVGCEVEEANAEGGRKGGDVEGGVVAAVMQKKPAGVSQREQSGDGEEELGRRGGDIAAAAPGGAGAGGVRSDEGVGGVVGSIQER